MPRTLVICGSFVAMPWHRQTPGQEANLLALLPPGAWTPPTHLEPAVWRACLRRAAAEVRELRAQGRRTQARHWERAVRDASRRRDHLMRNTELICALHWDDPIGFESVERGDDQWPFALPPDEAFGESSSDEYWH